MKNEDQENGFDKDIFIDTEEFVPAVMPSDVPGPDNHQHKTTILLERRAKKL